MILAGSEYTSALNDPIIIAAIKIIGSKYAFISTNTFLITTGQVLEVKISLFIVTQNIFR